VSLLEVTDLVVRHGQLTAVDRVALSVEAGSAVAVVGANGAGKSTLLRTISGLHRPAEGRIEFDGQDITAVSTHERVRRGLVMVPEGRRLFPSMTVEENLLVGAAVRRDGDWTLDRVYELFPWMTDRTSQPTGLLSGGEQQGVAIGRALMSNPRLLLLDEVSLGLAPTAVDAVYRSLETVIGEGTTVLLVEQDLTRALQVADRVACMLEGRIVLLDRAAALTREQVTTAYLGLGRMAPRGAPA
jgi:branched-chain amino acid transport system ATP-binding protein